MKQHIASGLPGGARPPGKAPEKTERPAFSWHGALICALRAWTVAGMGVWLATTSDARAAGPDFVYSYNNVWEDKADDYVISTVNAERVTYPASPPDPTVTFWASTVSDAPASVTQRFTFSRPTAQIYIYTRLAVYNWGWSSGSASFWASIDGTNWTQLLDAPVPSASAIASEPTLSRTLPYALLGATNLYTQARFQTTNHPFNAQWCRSVSPYPSPLFIITVTLVVAPPTIERQPKVAIWREGLDGRISVAVGGQPAPQVQWFLNGARIPGSITPTLVLPAVTRAMEGTYWLVASNALGRATSAPIVAVVGNVDPQRFVALSWLGYEGTGLTLDGADGLGPGATWQTLSHYPAAAIEQRFIELNTAPMRFYRLNGSGAPPKFTAASFVNGWSVDAAVGSRHRIEYTAASTGWTNWVLLTELVLPASPYLFLDESSLSEPVRVYRTTPMP